MLILNRVNNENYNSVSWPFVSIDCLQIWKPPCTFFCWYLLLTWPWRHGWNNVSRDHGIHDEFVYLTKPVVLCTISKRILCWSILALEPIANFCQFLGYWILMNWPRDHYKKGNLLHMQNLYVVFGTIWKIVSSRLFLSK